MKPLLLVLVFISPEHRERVAQSFDLIYAPNASAADRSQGAAQIAARGRDIRLVLTNGVIGLRADEIDAMPQLGLVCTLGVGYENVDVAHATARGVRVCNAAGTNDTCVADHTMALLLAAIRGLPTLNRLVRDGVWRDAIPRAPNVSGRKLGIVGLGAIGRKVAVRAQAFDMAVGYHGRTQRSDVPFAYFDSVLALATWADLLVVATPGGKATFHMIDAAVLQALGPTGVLVNISRGSTVDTAALADALQRKVIAAAALDVYESEPLPPAELVGFDNCLLTPHVAGISPHSMDAATQLFLDNALAFVEQRPLLTPIN